MMTMNMREVEVEKGLFWKENGNIHGYGHVWTWSLAVILLIFTCRFFTSRFRRRQPIRSFASDTALTSLRTCGIISDVDLKYLLSNLEDNSSLDSSIWENVVHKSRNSVSYTAKCCKPKDGPLKYLSITTFEDCSVDALFKFYLDNDYRTQWDKTVVEHQQLQVDSATEIGRTIKKFPFLTPREYVLAWRLWMGKDGSLYCFSKECEHPLVPKNRRYVRVAVFRSGWRIRKVPGRNACEIRLVHQEDAGLNVEMAKMAFAKGIWSYVCKMDDALRKYSDRKRQQSSSAPGARLTIQKVPPEFEVGDGVISTVDEVKPVVNDDRSSMIKLKRVPSSKVIANGLVLIGGAICLSKGHSSLGTKVAMAYLLSKFTNRGASPKKKGKFVASGDL